MLKLILTEDHIVADTYSQSGEFVEGVREDIAAVKVQVGTPTEHIIVNIPYSVIYNEAQRYAQGINYSFRKALNSLKLRAKPLSSRHRPKRKSQNPKAIIA